ncbi:hypothetical protein ACIQI7_21570 [Kitasatospora sp. NPDC092039]|uniref:hypothetical protein n=1 Tax=Kitasatospora sp. NPDC092039 TaxID=3364086 RepID=UPI003809737C
MTDPHHSPGPDAHRPASDIDPAVFAIERAVLAAHHAARAQRDRARQAEDERKVERRRAELAAALGAGERSTAEAAAWVAGLAARTGDRALEELAAAVLAAAET